MNETSDKVMGPGRPPSEKESQLSRLLDEAEARRRYGDDYRNVVRLKTPEKSLTTKIGKILFLIIFLLGTLELITILAKGIEIVRGSVSAGVEAVREQNIP